METITKPVDLISKKFQVTDLENSDQVTKAMRLAVADAVRTHKEKGHYMVAHIDGKIVHVQPEDLVVPVVPD